MSQLADCNHVPGLAVGMMDMRRGLPSLKEQRQHLRREAPREAAEMCKLMKAQIMKRGQAPWPPRRPQCYATAPETAAAHPGQAPAGWSAPADADVVAAPEIVAARGDRWGDRGNIHGPPGCPVGPASNSQQQQQQQGQAQQLRQGHSQGQGQQGGAQKT